MVLAVVATTLVITQSSAWATPQPTSRSAVHYVALGDSRAVGPTWLSFLAGDGCGRTATAYPALVAAAVRPASFTSVACSGARSENIVSVPQTTYTPLPHRVRVQAEALRANTTLVTLSIGGNDIDWQQLIAPCFGSKPGIDNRCRDDQALAGEIAEKLAQFAPAVDDVLRVIRSRSPRARIVVVGHGGYFGATGCFPDSNVHGADARFVRSFFARFNGVLRDDAVRRGATFVDVTGPAVGHDACAPPAQRWFTGLFTPGQTPFFHPTPLGSAAMAELVLAAIRS